MVTQKASGIGGLLRQGVRDLPDNAAWVWKQIRGLTTASRTRAATLIARRPGAMGRTVDADSMTKDELMKLARMEQISGRSSMTKAQLAAALNQTPKP